jgi:superfamily II DNA or RNA helicase
MAIFVSPPTSSFKQKTIKAYNDLPDSAATIVAMLAIAREPIGQAKLIAALAATKLRTLDQAAFSIEVLRTNQYLLLREGFLREDKRLGYSCPVEVADIISREVWQKNFPRYKACAEALRAEYSAFRWQNYFRDTVATERELRMMLFLGEVDSFWQTLRTAETQFYAAFKRDAFLLSVLGDTAQPDFELIAQLPVAFQVQWLDYLVAYTVNECNPIDVLETFILQQIQARAHEYQTGNLDAGRLLRYVGLVQGNKAKITAHFSDKSFSKFQFEAFFHLLEDNDAASILTYDTALKAFRSETNTKKNIFPSYHGIFFICALLKSQDADNIARLPAMFKTLVNGTNADYLAIYAYLQAAYYFLQNQKDKVAQLLQSAPTTMLDWLFYGFASVWCQKTINARELDKLELFYSKAKINGYGWLEMEFATILGQLMKSHHPKKMLHYQDVSIDLQTKLNMCSLVKVIPHFEQWELSLQALSNLAGSGADSNIAPTRQRVAGETRLAWLLDTKNSTISAKEQTLNKNGSWSAGRNIAAKRLKELDVTSMTDQDRKAVQKGLQVVGGYYGGEYQFDHQKMLLHLIGHPYLFLEQSPGVSCELIEKTPELIVEEKNNNYEIRFPYTVTTAGITLIKETPTRYGVMNIEEKHINIINALGGQSLKVPKEAQHQLAAIVGRLSSIITVQSTLIQDNTTLEKIEADSRIIVHLLPVGTGMKVEFYIKPFSPEPPYIKPGSGATNLIAEVSGVRKIAIRNLDTEKTGAAEVEAALKSIKNVEGDNFEWLLPEADDCLDVLLELNQLRTDNKVIVEWPKGEKFKILKRLDFDSLSLRVNRQNDWFSLSGEIKIGEDKVFNMGAILKLLSTQRKAQFIELGDGQFLAMTKQLQKQLKALADLAEPMKDGSLRFHSLAAGAIEDFTDNIKDFTADKAWKEHLKKIKNLGKFQATIPTTFQGELRPYQQEGFQWLSRLAHWGVGACLADDMGLGKTVQALTMLLNRAEMGAAFIVAPVSVCNNWEREAKKFAPTLNPIIFRGTDREEIVKNLKPYDILICSYGLMQQEEELLTKVKFATIILDEAQAIKNHAAKRTKTAMHLQSDFKVITTGTPIENHLGELWSLFNFINPGLLGGISHFQEKFGNPIDKNNDLEKKKHLKKLIQPFILRRRKSEVLDDLPEKTEITLSIPLSDEERAFYEALRRNAVQNIENMTDDGGDGVKKMKILAEIMRLRRACCNPNIVKPELGIKSSKLELFAETVEELLDNGHKALVFSQFVDHLRLISEYLDSKGIKYQYLDGSTPVKKREDAIVAFQSGKGGDLFLISLRAGGMGLNLTAADYVLHMDPWWNPAVEDQASDRAHRIGQTRPVTIYRLITENTIEEKILNLHAHKRDLADSLLEGTDSSMKVSADDLLALLKLV